MENMNDVSGVVKISLLVILCMQSSIYSILGSYSGVYLGEMWSKSSMLMMAEIIKIVISLIMIIREYKSESIRNIYISVKESLPMVIPAFLFWVMNQLGLSAFDRLDATTFMACSQLKILTTAGFSVVMMGKSIPYRKWKALILLVLGVILVSNGKYVNMDKKHKQGEVIGILTLLAQAIISGFSTVYFENVLKTGKFSLWERNLQLAIYSILFYIPKVIYDDRSLSFFHGWTIHSVILCIISGYGGLLIALTMKYTDSILKTFATSGAIIVTTILGYFFTNDPINIVISIGIICTILSLLNYIEGDCKCKQEEYEYECVDNKEENVEFIKSKDEV